MSGIIGKKLGMGQIFQEDGITVPVTYILCEPNKIIQIKDGEKDNASAFVLGAFELKKPRKTKSHRKLRQFSMPEKEIKKGDAWTLNDLGEIESVKIEGISKGKGFQGGVKRHNFGTARKTHGTKEPRHGATGACASPGRTKPGLKMAGHMGNAKVTVSRRTVVKVDNDRNVLAIKGSVPGSVNSTVYISVEK